MEQTMKWFKVILILTIAASGDATANSNSVCYDGYGCFYKTSPWNQTLFSKLPQSPSTINTGFKLYNAANPNGIALVTSTSGLTTSSKIVILVHGIDGGGHSNTMYTTLRPELLERKNSNNQKYLNVITVDWSGGVRNTDLLQSIGNSRLVSVQLAKLIKELKDANKLSCANVHIIGFSLGGSMAGLAGKRLRKKSSCTLARITGLDPVKSGFQYHFAQLPSKTKLERSDATYVDVIHTYSEHINRVGDADFYPNGGYRQTGCPAQDTSTIGETSACNHFRAVRLFKSSIRPNANNHCCKGTKCGSYTRFTGNLCSSNDKLIMGFESNMGSSTVPSGTYYLTTTGTDPYCDSSCPSKRY